MKKNKLIVGSIDRRSFLKETGIVLAGSTLAYHTGMTAPFSTIHKQPILKIGLIGCGGRGTGAAYEALEADPNVILTAMGDVFEDHFVYI